MVDRIAGTITDISDRKRAEAKLAESEEQYRLLTEHTASAIALHEIVFDADGLPVDFVILSANPAFESSLGLNAVDVLGRRLTEALPGIEKSQLFEVCVRVARSGEPESFRALFR